MLRLPISLHFQPARWLAGFATLWFTGLSGNAAEATPAAVAKADRTEVPGHIDDILGTYCITCHGSRKSKGEMTVHDLDGGLSAGSDLVRWEKVLKELRSGEMPPEDEDQPTEAEREAVIKWIKSGLREFAGKSVG